MQDGTLPFPDPDDGGGFPEPQGFLSPQDTLSPEWTTVAQMSHAELVGAGVQWTHAFQTRRAPQWTQVQFLSTQSYNYDALNRLRNISNPSNRDVAFSYDALSRRTDTTFQNGVTTQAVFDSNSRLTSLTHQNGSNPVSNFDYTYNAVNQRTALNTSRGIPSAATSLNYTYDILNRLSQATRPLSSGVDETFNYDPVGNRLNRDGQTGNSTFDDANGIVTDADFTYTHDANGNLITKTNIASGVVVEYSWDAENHLTDVVERPAVGQPASKTIAYAYDALDRRILKDVDGTLTKYVYDGEDLLHEYDSANILIVRYTHGGGTDEPLIMERDDGAILYYHTDGLGSVTELTDFDGFVAQSYAYDSYGNQTVFTPFGDPPTPNPFTYTGREFDEETGLYYYRARYYDSGIGRFLSEDPIGFAGQDINLYRYVGNDPVNFVDPDGLNRALAICIRLANRFGPRAEKAVKEFFRVKTRQTKDGTFGVKIKRKDGTEIDISSKRVKETKLEPQNPTTGFGKKTFPNAQPGSKGRKRNPTPAELKLLKNLTKPK